MGKMSTLLNPVRNVGDVDNYNSREAHIKFLVGKIDYVIG